MSTQLSQHTPLVCHGSAEEVADFCATLIISFALRKKESGKPFVFGTATGSSPQGVYRNLVEISLRTSPENFPIDASTRFVQLNNYLLRPMHPEGYDTEIAEKLVNPMGLDASQIIIPPTDFESALLENNIRKFDQIPEVHNVDVQLLGIGQNGHIGFIEPRKSSYSNNVDFAKEGTRLVALTSSTRAANSMYFDDSTDDVPTHAVTRGPRSILAAKCNLVIVNIFEKFLAAFGALEGPICEQVPASVLRFHSNTIFLVPNDFASTFGGMLSKGTRPIRDISITAILDRCVVE